MISSSMHANGVDGRTCSPYVDNTAIGERVRAKARSLHAKGGAVCASASGCACDCYVDYAAIGEIVEAGPLAAMP